MDKNKFIMTYSVDNTFDSDRFLKLRLRVCHDGESPNKTYFTKETMAEANKTLEYIPLLAHVFEDENGKPVIGAHDIHVEEDKLNEGEMRKIYDETPIGVVPSLVDNNCTIEEYEGKNYTFVDCYLWRDYANYAEQLVEDAENTKLSMEVDMADADISYDAANDRYNIDAYRYRGITLLNENCGTGMMKALATTGNFSANEDIKSKMIVLMEELQKCLREYDTANSDKKGVEDDMDNETVVETVMEETVTTEVEQEVVTDEVSEEPVVENEVIEEETPVEEFSDSEVEPLVCSFRISHDDTRYGLQSLLNAMCDDSHFYSVLAVYDKYFYYCDYFSGDAFKQEYKVRKDVVSFSGDPEPVFTEFVTQAERDELEKLRKDYAELKEFKANIEAAEVKAKKDAIFARDEYSILAEDENFKTLVADAAQFSVDEVESKVKTIFADHVIKVGMFSASTDESKKLKTIGVNFSSTEEKPKPYGTLFDNTK